MRVTFICKTYPVTENTDMSKEDFILNTALTYFSAIEYIFC